MSSSSNELLFLYDETATSEIRQANAQAVVNEEEWKREFRKRLFDAIRRFKSETLANRTRIHCADFKTIVTKNEAYAAEVRKLSVTAVQLLAASMLQHDLRYFKAEYVNLFVMREELRGLTNVKIEKKLQSMRDAGGEFYKIYDEIKSRRCKAR
jgi:hypothetical protein